MVFEEVGSEGGASSINTYDGMDLTYGKGFALTTLPGVLNALFAKDPSTNDLLMDAGMTLDQGKWLVVNTELGAIEEGMSALRLLEVDPKLLSLFITMGEDPKYAQTNLDVQWAMVMTASGKYPAYAETWSENAFKTGFHMAHWLPGFGWGRVDYGPTGADILKIVKTFAKAAAGKEKPNGAFLVPAMWGLQSHLMKFGGGAGLTALTAASGAAVAIDAGKVETDVAWKGSILIPEGKGTYRVLSAAP